MGGCTECVGDCCLVAHTKSPEDPSLPKCQQTLDLTTMPDQA